MPSPADATTEGLPLPARLGTVHLRPDGTFGIARAPRPATQRFVLDDLLFHIALLPEEHGTRVRIWVEIGYVPYTAQSAERRRDVLHVLRATRTLANACFALEGGQKILALGESLFREHLTIDGMMHETVLFVQEVRPFIRLLGNHL